MMEVLEVAELAEAVAQDNPQELTEVPMASESFLDKPFSEYTVSEGLLLIIVLLLLLSQLMRVVKGGFHWL